ncbi:Major facilitator superfamily domain general substrate transporter [Penicillium herquei]|nr:Major facilitator superfamily domain general substrate transporter [Penicillium herquei]
MISDHQRHEGSLDGHEAPQNMPDLEKLGKDRPSTFSSLGSEIAFCFSVVMSQILGEFFITGSNVITPTLVEELDIPEASTIWPATALSLAVTATLLIFGRLTDMYGGYAVYNIGLMALTVSSVLAGISQSWLMLVIFRAFQGLALAACLPSGMMLLGSVYRPGPRKNLVFSIYGGCAALGFFSGFFFSGLCSELTTWRWYFFVGAILSAITLFSSLFSIPRYNIEESRSSVQMDWAGCCLSIPAISLFVFAIADSAHAPQGWKTPYVLFLFIVGCLLLGLLVWVEGWMVKNPLLPGDIFHVKSMVALIIALLCLYGSLGIFLLYGVLYMSEFMGASPLQIVAWTAPMAVGGLVLSITGGLILHRVSGTILMIVSCLGYVGSGLLFATIPLGGNYWAFIFPAMICGTIGIDISFNLANVFITTKLHQSRQGLSGAIIYCTMHMGIAVMLGFADIVQTQTSHLGRQQSYKAVFWFESGLAILGLILVLLFVRIDQAESELTEDEKMQIQTSGREHIGTGLEV